MVLIVTSSSQPKVYEKLSNRQDLAGKYDALDLFINICIYMQANTYQPQPFTEDKLSTFLFLHTIHCIQIISGFACF